MKKALKVIIKVACICGAIGLLFQAYDMINAKIKKIKYESWHEAWHEGFNAGHNSGRGNALFMAKVYNYITDEEYDELVEITK